MIRTLASCSRAYANTGRLVSCTDCRVVVVVRELVYHSTHLLLLLRCSLPKEKWCWRVRTSISQQSARDGVVVIRTLASCSRAHANTGVLLIGINNRENAKKVPQRTLSGPLFSRNISRKEPFCVPNTIGVSTCIYCRWWSSSTGLQRMESSIVMETRYREGCDVSCDCGFGYEQNGLASRDTMLFRKMLARHHQCCAYGTMKSS